MPTAAPALIALCAGSASAQIFTNPGFESGLTGWTTSQGNGSATFSTITASPSPFFGSNSAKIVVTSAGTTFPSLKQTFTADASQTYLLRYYAQASTNRPTMHIQVTSASGPVYSAAKINPSSNGWEEYHWPFKASGLTTVTFTFEQATTYNLDQVQVYDTNSPADQNNTIMDPAMFYLWHWGQTAGAAKGLMNTDNDISCPLPDGRVAWVFNDTYTGTINPYNNSGGTVGFVRNVVMLQNGGALTPWVAGQTAFTPAISGDWTWPTDAFVEGNTLKIILPDISSSQTNGVNVATLSLPSLTQTNMSGYLPWNVSKVLDAGDGFLYLYNNKQVARVPLGSFNTTSAWRYWDGSTWNTSVTAATDMPNFNTPWSMERIGPNNFVETYAGFVGGTMRARFAAAPQGPWDSTDYTIATPTWEADNSYYYMPYLHRQTYQNGVYSVGYSDIGPSGADGDGAFLSNRPGADQCFYNTEFFRTPNLLTLSPHTTTSFLDTFAQNDAGGWATYGGPWTAANGSFSTASNSISYAILKGIISSNVTLDANVTPGSGGDAGLVFRTSNYSAAANGYNGYYVGLIPGTGVELGTSNGSYHNLTTAAMTITAGVTYSVRVVATGTSIQVFVNNLVTPVISTTDSTYASGGVGIRAHGNAATWNNFNVNNGYSTDGEQAETESLTATFTTGVTHRIFTWGSFSGGQGTILDATAAGQQVTYTLPAIGSGTYDVRVGTKKTSTRGTFQLAVASALNQNYTNVGAVQDEYASTDQFAEYDLGNWSPGSNSDKLFRFTVQGKNASSTGYTIAFDYIKLIPQ